MLIASWKTRVGPATYKSYVSMLRGLLRGMRPDLLSTLPRVKNPHTHYPAISPEDIARMEAAATPWLRTLIILATQTGMRRSDLIRLTEADLSGDTLSIVMHKTKRPITIPVSERLKELVANLPEGDPHDPIVHRMAVKFGRAHPDKPLSAEAITKAWSNLRRKLALNPRLCLHSIRHTVALSTYSATKDVRVVQAVLGHTSLVSTATYLEHFDPTLRKTLDALWHPRGPIQ